MSSKMLSHVLERHLRPSLSVIPLTPPSCLLLLSLRSPTGPNLRLSPARHPDRPRRLLGHTHTHTGGGVLIKLGYDERGKKTTTVKLEHFFGEKKNCRSHCSISLILPPPDTATFCLLTPPVPPPPPPLSSHHQRVSSEL